MKKIFTLIVAMMAMMSSVNAEEFVLFDGSAAFSWGGTRIDCSSLPASGLTLHVTFDVPESGWWQFKFTKSDWSTYIPLVGTNEFVNPQTSGLSMNAGTYTFDLDLTDEQLAAMKPAINFQGSGGTLKKLTVTSQINYQNPVELSMNQWGQVEAKAFNGFSDDAKITLTYEVKGASGFVGWGAGCIKSLDGKVEYGSNAIAVKNEGENKMSFKLGDVKALLNSGPSEYGQYGIGIATWPFSDGACTTTLKSLVIQEVEDFAGKGYRSPDTEASTSMIGYENNTTPWWAEFSDYYTVNEGNKARIAFKNYSNKEKNWNNWLIVYNVAGTKRGDANYAEYAVYRADNYGWGVNYNESSRKNNYNWTTFLEDMDGSDVVLEVYNTAGVIYGKAEITTAAGKVYNYSFNTTDTKAKDFGFFLTVEKGHLTDVDVMITAIPTVTGDEVHAFYDWFLLCAKSLNQGAEFKDRDLASEYQSVAYPILLAYDGGDYAGKIQAAKNELAQAFLDLFKGTSMEALAKMYVAQAEGSVATSINNVTDKATRTGKFIQNGRVVISKNGKTYTTTGALLK